MVKCWATLYGMTLMDYCGPLLYRSVHFRIETFDREHYQSNSVVNYPNNYDFTRIHEYKYYLNDRSDRTVIAKEYSEDLVPGKNDRFYPIPKEENVALYNRYLEAAKQKYPDMVFLGRQGDGRYGVYSIEFQLSESVDSQGFRYHSGGFRCENKRKKGVISSLRPRAAGSWTTVKFYRFLFLSADAITQVCQSQGIRYNMWGKTQ